MVILAIVLVWSRTCGAINNLQMIFGLPLSSISVWLRFGTRILIKVLHDHPLAKVELPTDEQLAEFQAAIIRKYPLLTNV